MDGHTGGCQCDLGIKLTQASRQSVRRLVVTVYRRPGPSQKFRKFIRNLRFSRVSRPIPSSAIVLLYLGVGWSALALRTMPLRFATGLSSRHLVVPRAQVNDSTLG